MTHAFRNLSLILLMIIGFSVTAQDNRLQIVASHSILADVVSNVAGDVADVMTTMPVGADPHSFQAVPSDLVALANADIIFINGALFEEGLLEAIENARTDMNIVVASSCVEILTFGTESSEHEIDEHATETGAMSELCDEHESEIATLDDTLNEYETAGHLYALDCGESGHEEEGNEHNHGACDPHVWMNPHNVMFWTMLIRDTLIELDPQNAETYTANANAYIAELNSLTHDFIIPMLESVPEDNRLLITNHDTLGYFATSFDFEIASTVIPGGNTLSEPGAADVATVIDLIRETGVRAIFAETTVADAITQTIADETGAVLYVLYSGSLSDATGEASTYIDYMRYNVTTITEALGGGM